jgi:hypothetical protein
MRIQMLKYLNRVLDRNKPLFIFNTKNAPPTENVPDQSTPSFSMVDLVNDNNK